jgi:eukaryotic-like serine/threonine-protein kinase
VKEKVWSRDWFAAVAFSVVFAALSLTYLSDSFESIERYTYDLGVKARQRAPSDKVAVVAIDDQSIGNLGRWPWPRSLQAQLTEKLREGGAKVIANTVLYFEPEQGSTAGVGETIAFLQNSPLTQQIPVEIETFSAMLADGAARSSLVAGIAKAYQESALTRDYVQQMNLLLEKLQTAAQAGGSGDAELAAALKAHGRVVMPMLFALGSPQGKPDQSLPDYVQKNRLTNVQDRVSATAEGNLPIPTLSEGLGLPIPQLGSQAYGIGHLNDTLDVDGAVRNHPLVLRHYDEFYPSFALMVAAAALNLTPADIVLNLGEGIQLGGQSIGTTPALRMYTHYYADRDGVGAFPVDSAYDILAGKIPVSKYKDKVVLIGTTAAGIGDQFATPVSPATWPVVTLAHTVSSILQADFFTRPAWAWMLEKGVLLVLVLYLALLVPALKPALGAALTAILVIGLLVTEVSVQASSALWFQFTVAALFVASGHAFMLLKRLNLTERLKVASETEGAESNKMLGLAFQGQGQLDMAFEKFRRVKPVDDKVLDLIYNLALDFERKRQFNKAESCYQYIGGFNKEFRDVAQKLNRAKKLSETVILGGGGSHPGGTLILNSGADADATQAIEKPKLGRYEVDKELGKGAMGIVYLGKDPKIGRTVAIKTMALTQQFDDPAELASVKERFFREAETAGRLSHPNIVQIFDAGEEHDLAYIAMEFIKGHDLTKHIKAGALLPIEEVLKYVADAADALDYAHQNNIVHRDIKPANMMLVEATKTIKLMDFGIARISDSSKTKTGMVLGTPSYMSPEQLAGKKVDGRSDLWSLGVTLYQLLTGKLPFQADSMATLMFKIANEPHTPISTMRAELPPKLNVIIDRAINKNLEQRYQRGAEIARDLRFLLSGGNA